MQSFCESSNEIFKYSERENVLAGASGVLCRGLGGGGAKQRGVARLARGYFISRP
jgi:hypothetical protein